MPQVMHPLSKRHVLVGWYRNAIFYQDAPNASTTSAVCCVITRWLATGASKRHFNNTHVQNCMMLAGASAT
jgi:hypothetical protein